MGINLGCPVFKIFICHVHCVCIDVHVLVEVFSCLLLCGAKLGPPGKVASAFAY